MSVRDQYKKQRKAYLNKLRYYAKKGYTVPDPPKIPKKVTQASVRKLEKLSASLTNKYSTKSVKPKPPKIETNQRQKLKTETEISPISIDASNIIIDNYLSMIESEFPDFYNNIIDPWITALIESYEKPTVAEMITEGYRTGLIVTWEIAYYPELQYQYMEDHMKLLNVDDKTAREFVDFATKMDFDMPDNYI